MNIEALERELLKARERHEAAVRRLAHEGGAQETAVHQDAVLRAERALAAARGEPYASPWPWPVEWAFSIHPSPLVLGEGLSALVLYEALGSKPASPRIAILKFESCSSMRLGDPNDEVIQGHPLSGKGIDLGGAYIVENSQWLGELEATNRVHRQYDPAYWRAQRHYLLFFKDHTFECVARSASSRIVEGPMREALAQAALDVLR